jgi:hypothetical protein
MAAFIALLIKRLVNAIQLINRLCKSTTNPFNKNIRLFSRKFIVEEKLVIIPDFCKNI